MKSDKTDLKIELEFLDRNRVRLHEDFKVYVGAAPAYGEGDTVEFNGQPWTIMKQEIIDFSGLDDYRIDIKITLWCEKV